MQKIQTQHAVQVRLLRHAQLAGCYEGAPENPSKFNGNQTWPRRVLFFWLRMNQVKIKL